jgi:hypothetical protein
MPNVDGHEPDAETDPEDLAAPPAGPQGSASAGDDGPGTTDVEGTQADAPVDADVEGGDPAEHSPDPPVRGAPDAGPGPDDSEGQEPTTGIGNSAAPTPGASPGDGDGDGG